MGKGRKLNNFSLADDGGGNLAPRVLVWKRDGRVLRGFCQLAPIRLNMEFVVIPLLLLLSGVWQQLQCQSSPPPPPLPLVLTYEIVNGQRHRTKTQRAARYNHFNAIQMAPTFKSTL